MPGFKSAIATIGIICFTVGYLYAAGLPWLWHMVIRPFLLWLAV